MRAGHPGAEPAHSQVGAHETVDWTPSEAYCVPRQMGQIGVQLRQRVIARGAVSPEGEMGGKTFYAERWYAAVAVAVSVPADQGTKLFQIGGFERGVIGKSPGDKTIDNFLRQSKEMFIERFEVAVSIGPLAELRPDVGAGRAPARMQEDRCVAVNSGSGVGSGVSLKIGLDWEHLFSTGLPQYG